MSSKPRIYVNVIVEPRLIKTLFQFSSGAPPPPYLAWTTGHLSPHCGGVCERSCAHLLLASSTQGPRRKKNSRYNPNSHAETMLWLNIFTASSTLISILFRLTILLHRVVLSYLHPGRTSDSYLPFFCLVASINLLNLLFCHPVALDKGTGLKYWIVTVCF